MSTESALPTHVERTIARDDRRRAREVQATVDAADVAAEERGFARGVNAVIDVLRGYRGSVAPMSAISDAKRLLEKPRTP